MGGIFHLDSVGSKGGGVKQQKQNGHTLGDRLNKANTLHGKRKIFAQISQGRQDNRILGALYLASDGPTP